MFNILARKTIQNKSFSLPKAFIKAQKRFFCKNLLLFLFIAFSFSLFPLLAFANQSRSTSTINNQGTTQNSSSVLTNRPQYDPYAFQNNSQIYSPYDDQNIYNQNPYGQNPNNMNDFYFMMDRDGSNMSIGSHFNLNTQNQNTVHLHRSTSRIITVDKNPRGTKQNLLDSYYVEKNPEKPAEEADKNN